MCRSDMLGDEYCVTAKIPATTSSIPTTPASAHASARLRRSGAAGGASGWITGGGPMCSCGGMPSVTTSIGGMSATCVNCEASTGFSTLVLISASPQPIPHPLGALPSSGHPVVPAMSAMTQEVSPGRPSRCVGPGGRAQAPTGGSSVE